MILLASLNNLFSAVYRAGEGGLSRDCPWIGGHFSVLLALRSRLMGIVSRDMVLQILLTSLSSCLRQCFSLFALYDSTS